MSLAKETFKNSIWNLCGFLWPLGLIFLSIPFFLNRLGAEQYGIWVLVRSTVGVFEVLNFGVGDALIKFISEYRGRNDWLMIERIVSNSFLIYMGVSVTVSLIGFLSAPFFIDFFDIKGIYRHTAILIFQIATIGFIVNLFLVNALSIFKGFQRYDLSTLTTLVTDTLRILGMMALVYWGFGIEGMVITYSVGAESELSWPWVF